MPYGSETYTPQVLIPSAEAAAPAIASPSLAALGPIGIMASLASAVPSIAKLFGAGGKGQPGTASQEELLRGEIANLEFQRTMGYQPGQMAPRGGVPKILQDQNNTYIDSQIAAKKAQLAQITQSQVQSAAQPMSSEGGDSMGFLSNLFRGVGGALGGAANSIGGAINSIGGGIGNAASTLMDLFRGQGPNPILSQGGNLPTLTMGTMGHTPPVGQAAFPAGGGGMGGGWGGQTQPFQTQPLPGGGMGGGFNQQWNPLSGIGGWLSGLFGGGGSPPPNFPGMGNQDSTALAMQALQDPLEARLASMAGLPGGAGYNQLTTQQLQNSPYRQGMPGFGPAPQNFWQRFLSNIQNRLMPQQSGMMQPQGFPPQTGFSAGESGGNENKDFFGLADPTAALGGLGVLGIGELLNKPINMPDFQNIPQVKELSDWSHTANHPLDPNVQASIQRTLDIQNEQQLRNLRDVYKNARPGTDYTTDSAYQRDLERLNRSMAMQGADAMAGSQLASNQMHLGNLGNLSQLAVGQNLGQAGIEAQRQRARNQMFGNIGGMLGYKGIFGNRGPGIMAPWNQNQGQGVTT